MSLRTGISEFRSVALHLVGDEERAYDDGRSVDGYATVFNKVAHIRDAAGEYDEVFLPGSFRDSLRASPPRLLWEHGKGHLGKLPIGTIHAAEDATGLRVQGRLFSAADFSGIREAANAGQLGLSVHFTVPSDGSGDTWSRSASTRSTLRTVSRANLPEISLVSFPASANQLSVRGSDVLARDAMLRAIGILRPEPEPTERIPKTDSFWTPAQRDRHLRLLRVI